MEGRRRAHQVDTPRFSLSLHSRLCILWQRCPTALRVCRTWVPRQTFHAIVIWRWNLGVKLGAYSLRPQLYSLSLSMLPTTFMPEQGWVGELGSDLWKDVGF